MRPNWFARTENVPAFGVSRLHPGYTHHNRLALYAALNLVYHIDTQSASRI
jgi:hypothetical protein